MDTTLTYDDIVSDINAGRLIRNAVVENVQSCSYDLRIGTIFNGGEVIRDHQSVNKRQVVIYPGEVISVFTKEELLLDDRTIATAFGMNGHTSRGLLVLNPGHVDPGWEGPLTVKILNLRKVPLAINMGQEIFTVVFRRMGTSTSQPYKQQLSRERLERAFNSKDVESAPTGLTELIDVSEVTSDQVNYYIQRHWMSYFAGLLAIGTFVAAVFGAIFAYKGASASNGSEFGRAPDLSIVDNVNYFSVWRQLFFPVSGNVSS